MTNLTNFQRDMMFASPESSALGMADGGAGTVSVSTTGLVPDDVNHCWSVWDGAAVGANFYKSVGCFIAPSTDAMTPYRVQMFAKGSSVMGCMALVPSNDVAAGVDVDFLDVRILGDAVQGIDQVICMQEKADNVPLFFLSWLEQPAQIKGGHVSVQRCVVQPPKYASAVS